MRTEIVRFNHQYTPEDIESMKLMLSNLVIEKRKLDREKLEILNKYHDQIEMILEKINSISDVISLGYEQIEEECEMRANFQTMKMEYYSNTFQRVVKTRPLSPEERQLKID